MPRLEELPMTRRSEWEEFFDGHAPIYEQNVFTRNTLVEVDFLVEVLGLGEEAALLDLGCGTGRHSVELARRGFRVTGVDLSQGMLTEARRSAERAGVTVEWRKGDAGTFRPGGLFDAVICLCEGGFGLLGAADDPVRQPLAILKTIAVSLKPAAPFLITVLNGLAMARRNTPADAESGKFDPQRMVEVSDCRPTPEGSPIELWERGFVPTELILMAETVGLEVTDIWGGTAGRWGRRAIDLDEMEIMVVGRQPIASD